MWVDFARMHRLAVRDGSLKFTLFSKTKLVEVHQQNVDTHRCFYTIPRSCLTKWCLTKWFLFTSYIFLFICCLFQPIRHLSFFVKVSGNIKCNYDMSSVILGGEWHILSDQCLLLLFSKYQLLVRLTTSHCVLLFQIFIPRFISLINTLQHFNLFFIADNFCSFMTDSRY